MAKYTAGEFTAALRELAVHLLVISLCAAAAAAVWNGEPAAYFGAPEMPLKVAVTLAVAADLVASVVSNVTGRFRRPK